MSEMGRWMMSAAGARSRARARVWDLLLTWRRACPREDWDRSVEPDAVGTSGKKA